MQSTTRDLDRSPPGKPSKPFSPLLFALALAAGLLAGQSLLPAATFLRGDANGDGHLDIADPIALLGLLFSGCDPVPCLDAADADDSGSVDISDPIGVLDYLYRGGVAPPPPFPAAGSDPTTDGLDCEGQIDDRVSMAASPTDQEDLAVLADPGATAATASEGDPLLVDGSTFDALLSLADGQPLSAALGESSEPFLTAFFRGQPPEPPPAAAVAGDAIAPMDADGCFLIPAALIDRRSQQEAVPGEFRRGDVNADGRVDAEDARIIAECLDGAGPCPLSCWDAADANDDGQVTFSDSRLILQAVNGWDWLPGPIGACAPDLTPDSLPPCSSGWCASGAPDRRLSVRPAVVCGIGPHRVELEISEEDEDDGSIKMGLGIVTLCSRGEEGCQDTPLGLPPKGGSPSGPPYLCRWIMSVDYDPKDVISSMKQTCFNESGGIEAVRHSLPLKAWGGGMEIFRTDNGPGPVHYLHTNRMAANCNTPPSSLSFVESGDLDVRVNLFCLTTDGLGSVRLCDSTAEVEGTYTSRVEAGTSAGPSCDEAPNSVDALAQDETTFKVNKETLFNKAVAVQNGNEVTTSPSFTTHFGVNLGKDGLAADVGVNVGFSSTVVHHTGQSVDQLDAFGNTTVHLPLTANLHSKGKVETSAQNRTSSRTKSETRVAGIWLVAKTDCPVDGPLFVEAISGDEGEVAKTKKKAEEFRKTRISN